MNLAETHDLLTFVAAYDNRRFDDATVLAWHPIFEDMPFVDCRDAVIRHFAESTEYLMPVHIRRGADEIRRDRKRRQREMAEAEAKAIEAADPSRYDRSDEVRELIMQLRTFLPAGDPDKLRRAEWVEHEKRREREARAEPNPHFDPAVLAAAVGGSDGSITA